jgi:hypothetical protein
MERRPRELVVKEKESHTTSRSSQRIPITLRSSQREYNKISLHVLIAIRKGMMRSIVGSCI